MLDETTILPLLKDTENERTERTVSINATEKFGQAICAFANDIMNTGKPAICSSVPITMENPPVSTITTTSRKTSPVYVAKETSSRSR